MHVLIRLLTFLRPYKRRVALAWLCVCGASLFVLVTPQLVRWAIDTGLKVRIEGAEGGLMPAANGQLALVSWAFLPFIAWRSVVMTTQLRPIWLRVQDGMARLGTVMQESLAGGRVGKAFS